MYGKTGATLLAAPPAVLAFTGFGALWYVVLACTLLAAGFAVLRLVPRRKG